MDEAGGGTTAQRDAPRLPSTVERAFVNAMHIEQATELLAEHGSDACVLAGGTDIMVQYPRGEITPQLLLHVREIRELQETSVADAGTRLGALTTHHELATTPALANRHISLSEAARTVGGRQTQNVGTIGGNVVNASPAADLLPPLLCSNARVTMRSARGERTLALDEFLVGRKETALEADELVTELALDAPGPRTGEVYLKVGRRGAMEVALAGLAARIELDESGAVADARVSVCAVAPTAFRAAEAEQALTGTTLEADTVAEAGRLLAERASPIDDVRATAGYRERVLPRLLGRALEICHRRAKGRA